MFLCFSVSNEDGKSNEIICDFTVLVINIFFPRISVRVLGVDALLPRNPIQIQMGE